METFNSYTPNKSGNLERNSEVKEMHRLT